MINRNNVGQQGAGAIKSPVERYLDWKPKKPEFLYYDKEAEENVSFSSIDIIFITHAYHVTGWSSEYDSPLHSNLVTNASKQPMKVIATKNANNSQVRVIANGLWTDIKAAVAEDDGKWTRAFFCLANTGENGAFELVKIDFSASGLATINNIIDPFNPSEENFNTVYTLEKGLQKKKKGTKFYLFNGGSGEKDDDAVVKSRPMTEAEVKLAQEKTDLMTEYLNSKIKNPDAEEEQAEAVKTEQKSETSSKAKFDDDLPF